MHTRSDSPGSMASLHSEFNNAVPKVCPSLAEFNTSVQTGAGVLFARLQALRDMIGFGEGLSVRVHVRQRFERRWVLFTPFTRLQTGQTQHSR